jgi:hypothetical protein
MSTSRSYNPAPHRALTVPLAKARLPKHRDGLSNAVMMLGMWGTETDADAETETGRSHLGYKETEWT